MPLPPTKTPAVTPSSVKVLSAGRRRAPQTRQLPRSQAATLAPPYEAAAPTVIERPQRAAPRTTLAPLPPAPAIASKQPAAGVEPSPKQLTASSQLLLHGLAERDSLIPADHLGPPESMTLHHLLRLIHKEKGHGAAAQQFLTDINAFAVQVQSASHSAQLRPEARNQGWETDFMTARGDAKKPRPHVWRAIVHELLYNDSPHARRELLQRAVGLNLGRAARPREPIAD